MNIIWHSGEWINETQPIFKFTNRIRYGDGIFDTMLVVDGTLIHSEKHLTRLSDNAQIFDFEIPQNLQAIAEQLIEKNNATSGRYAINAIITRGQSERGLAVPREVDNTISIRLSKVPSEFPIIHAIISRTVRRNEGSPLSQIKSCNYGDNILALSEARKAGANEAILLNNASHVTCAASSNIFAIKDDKIATPPLSDGVLNGVIRDLFIARYDVEVKSITIAELQNADAVLLTNSIRGAQFIESLDGRELPGTNLHIDKNFHLL